MTIAQTRMLQGFTETGCCDCGKSFLTASPETPWFSEVFSRHKCHDYEVFEDNLNDHFLIIYKTEGEPEKVFMSCQPFNNFLVYWGARDLRRFVRGDTASLKPSIIMGG
jgi:hypothetical protein